jgi:hypothetical protein
MASNVSSIQALQRAGLQVRKLGHKAATRKCSLPRPSWLDVGEGSGQGWPDLSRLDFNLRSWWRSGSPHLEHVTVLHKLSERSRERGLQGFQGLRAVGGAVPGLALQITETPGNPPANWWVFRAYVAGRRRAPGLALARPSRCPPPGRRPNSFTGRFLKTAIQRHFFKWTRAAAASQATRPPTSTRRWRSR